MVEYVDQSHVVQGNDPDELLAVAESTENSQHEIEHFERFQGSMTEGNKFFIS